MRRRLVRCYEVGEFLSVPRTGTDYRILDGGTGCFQTTLEIDMGIVFGGRQVCQIGLLDGKVPAVEGWQEIGFGRKERVLSPVRQLIRDALEPARFDLGLIYPLTIGERKRSSEISSALLKEVVWHLLTDPDIRSRLSANAAELSRLVRTAEGDREQQVSFVVGSSDRESGIRAGISKDGASIVLLRFREYNFADAFRLTIRECGDRLYVHACGLGTDWEWVATKAFEKAVGYEWIAPTGKLRSSLKPGR